jgi:hypothetical protein
MARCIVGNIQVPRLVQGLMTLEAKVKMITIDLIDGVSGEI